MNYRLAIIVFFLCMAVQGFGFAPGALAKQRLVFGGGPAGGTFQVVAEAIQNYTEVKDNPEFTVQAQTSADSIENLRQTNIGRMQFSSVYSGEVWQGRNGMLPNDAKKYEAVLAVAYLYGTPAQLIIRKGSGIASVKDLVGKRVGVGSPGFPAFINCERFFEHLGIWDKIERRAMGYNDAAAAFSRNQLDAFWLFTAFPSSAVIAAAQTSDIDLVDLAADARASGYFDKYRYFFRLTIPAGTYRGVDRAVGTFQDSVLWVANANVPDEVVYKLLGLIFTDDGLAYMVSKKKTFKEMSLAGGATGIVTPMHPGALKFWKEKGVLN
jgi:TRAP transporter TAXI family solute receptor